MWVAGPSLRGSSNITEAVVRCRPSCQSRRYPESLSRGPLWPHLWMPSRYPVTSSGYIGTPRAHPPHPTGMASTSHRPQESHHHKAPQPGGLTAAHFLPWWDTQHKACTHFQCPSVVVSPHTLLCGHHHHHLQNLLHCLKPNTQTH